MRHSLITTLASTALVALAISCSKDRIVRSDQLPLTARIEELGKAIILKSKPIDVHFLLLDANATASIPGASGKDYKIFMRVKPEESKLWTVDKNNWLTSFPRNRNWIGEIITDPKLLRDIEASEYFTYYKEESGYEYTLWVNEKQGIILIRYIQK